MNTLFILVWLCGGNGAYWSVSPNGECSNQYIDMGSVCMESYPTLEKAADAGEKKGEYQFWVVESNGLPIELNRGSRVVWVAKRKLAEKEKE